MKTILETLMKRETLSDDQVEELISTILDDNTSPLQIAAALGLLRAKPEKASEISAMVNSLNKKMTTVSSSSRVLDIVGTGGDGAKTVNISTGSAILAACGGVKIAKHGNRAVSSLAGSADLLKALGINIELSPEKISQCIDEVGMGFCYAPYFHPLLLKLRKLRKELNIPTTFNFIGPLLNPAKASHLMVGVMDPMLMDLMAEVLFQLGTKHSMIVYGNGLDEISTLGPVQVIEIKNNNMKKFILDPKAYGFSYCRLEALQGGDAKINARLLEEVFEGKQNPLADTLILNASVASYLYGLYPSIQASVSFVKNNLKSGKALALLNRYREFTHDVSA